jgi:hypothetical protein
MIQRRVVLLFGTLLAAVAASPMKAQICEGLASYRTAPFQVAASGSFSDDATGFSGSLGFGGAGLFGSVGLGVISFDELDGSGFALGGGAGYDALIGENGIVAVCPEVSLAQLFGPNDILGLGYDYSETDFAFGGAVGVIATQTDQIGIIPTAGLAFNVAIGRLEDALGNSESETETFGSVALGVGFVFSQIVSFRPQVVIPFGLEGGDVSFGATLSVNFGKTSQGGE